MKTAIAYVIVYAILVVICWYWNGEPDEGYERLWVFTAFFVPLLLMVLVGIVHLLVALINRLL